MNVAIVLLKYRPFGGYERQAALLAEALAGRGDRVTVVTGQWDGPERDGITIRKVPVIKLASWLKVLSFAYFSRRCILGEPGGFDAVVAFDRTPVMDIYRAGNACHKEWQAFRSASEGIWGRLSMLVNPLNLVINHVEGRIFSRVQSLGGRIVVLSEAGMRQIRRHYAVDPDRFVVIPPAVDLERLGPVNDESFKKEARASLNVDDRTMLLLHVGSGFKIKGLKSTIGALAEITKAGHRAVLLVAGSDRSGTERLKALARGLGVGEAVRFLGGVKDVGRLYAASDVFVLPSLFETFGTAAVEALASGLPVVIGRGAGAADFIEKERAGTVVDVPAEPEGLASLIEAAFYNDKALLRSGRLDEERTRRRSAALLCSREAVMNRFMALIDEMAENTSGHAGGRAASL